jgi:hypothetical protein
MKRFSKKCVGIFSVLFILISQQVLAESFSVDNIVDKSILTELKEKGKIEKTYFNKKNSKLTLTPKTPLAEKNVKIWPGEKGAPVYVAEELYLLDKKSLGSGDSNKTTIDFASKVIRSVSKMEGMKYYSHTDKKIETLYTECYCIKGPKDRTRIADDTNGSAEGKIMYCLQNDNSFGKTNYRLEYHQTENETSACFMNTTPIYMGIVKGIDTDDMRIGVVITDCGDTMLVYMLVQAKMPALSLFEKTMNDSFGSRLDAIYKWFILQF